MPGIQSYPSDFLVKFKVDKFNGQKRKKILSDVEIISFVGGLLGMLTN